MGDKWMTEVPWNLDHSKKAVRGAAFIQSLHLNLPGAPPKTGTGKAPGKLVGHHVYRNRQRAETQLTHQFWKHVRIGAHKALWAKIKSNQSTGESCNVIMYQKSQAVCWAGSWEVVDERAY